MKREAGGGRFQKRDWPAAQRKVTRLKRTGCHRRRSITLLVFAASNLAQKKNIFSIEKYPFLYFML